MPTYCQCPKCNVSLLSKNLARHFKKTHNTSDYSIEIATQRPTEQQALKIPYKSKPKNPENSASTTCPICGLKTSKRNLRQHLIKSHSGDSNQTNFPEYFTASPTKITKTTSCSICGEKLEPQSIKKHFLENHKTEQNIATPNTPSKKTTPASPDSSQSHQMPLEQCPICDGDGGVRGGCWKCDGTGWIHKEADSGKTYKTNKHPHDNSRISNHDYQGSNIGAHYREINGRIGSNPEHDDYSEEGFFD